jgi:hypothetical protein
MPLFAFGSEMLDESLTCMLSCTRNVPHIRAWMAPVDSVRESLLHYRLAHLRKPVSQNANHTHFVA